MAACQVTEGAGAVATGTDGGGGEQSTTTRTAPILGAPLTHAPMGAPVADRPVVGTWGHFGGVPCLR
jgi:hypothetical protein